RLFVERLGISKSESYTDMTLLEDCLREDLDARAQRAFAVLSPLKVVITNYPENQTEALQVHNHPKNQEMGTRTIYFGRELFIDRDDFMENPPENFFRLGPGQEVRLRFAYVIRCDEVLKDPNTGEIQELRCVYYPETIGGKPTSDGRKIKGIIHWVEASKALTAEVRLYDRLFNVEIPDGDKDVDYKTHLNPDSIEILENCKLEPSLEQTRVDNRYQFERLGYFCPDKDSTTQKPVFNRAVTLRDTWAKLQKDS
ncbi:MAG: glutamine--tRNA ligase, partial [SAR324 cluster bacterium]|nr:glutamine--tRNA ligase [SAR324 cluster bacterium]